jgi:hypothetical protein
MGLPPPPFLENMMHGVLSAFNYSKFSAIHWLILSRSLLRQFVEGYRQNTPEGHQRRDRMDNA